MPINAAELKLRIFRQIDSMEENKLQELYGLLINYINGQKDVDDWTALTEEQKQGIFSAIAEIDAGKGIPHNEVVSKYRKKYSDA